MGAAALGLAAWLFQACGERVASGGDATETGNARVAGQVVREDGLPMAGAEVAILPSDFIPLGAAAVPDSQKDTTDGRGHYRFTRLKEGRYNLMVQHRETRTRSILFGIRLEADSVNVPEDTLHAPGAMSVPLPETSDSGVGYIYIPGTTYRKRIDSELRIAGSVVLDSLPPGIMPSVVYAKGESDARTLVIATEVAVRESALSQVNAYAAWAHSAKLAMNTSKSGTETTRDQRDFPLLVRLSAPAFDFSAAAPGGADLRFAKADGTPLPREIESWDAQAGRAEIWVRVDTVRADAATQFITMHWGKADAAAPRNRRPVFDTTAGFSAAWHLSEEAAGAVSKGLYKDATGAGNDGDDHLSNASRAGVIGYGHHVDSGEYILSPKASPGLRLASAFTISVWYRSTCKGCGSAGGDVISIGDNFGLRIRSDSLVHLWYWPATPPSALGWYEVDARRGEYTDGNWHQAFGTFDGAVLRLYVDGNEVGNIAAPQGVGLQFPLNVTFGKHGNVKQGYEYAGDLDEAQVHAAVRDPDWIKLSFENQKSGAKFPALTGP
ncbi:MAG TPA: DUF2341 domain-containing protein [Fibrobacteria bacterium]|nr:DUF2341 domain-containing protein [Fibrobacteria bacterium]